MISIVIPTYNRAHLISRAIKSVLSQTFTAWQLIVVNDGSQDNTDEVIEQFLGDNRIKYVKKNNTGAADTRNVGVAHATFPWVTFLDSDDEAYPHWLSRFSHAIDHGEQIISCGLEKYDEHGKLITTVVPKQTRVSKGGQFTHGGVYIMPKELFLELGGFDAKVRAGQHTEFSFRLKGYAVKHNINTYIISEPLVKIHIHAGYRIRSDFKAKYEGSLYTYTKHYNDALSSKKMRSLFEGLIAYNAFKLRKHTTAVKFGIKSFINRPCRKTFERLVRYIFRMKY
jgi:glycosyltransferase involved in cell wall biosynthesis